MASLLSGIAKAIEAEADATREPDLMAPLVSVLASVLDAADEVLA